MLQAAPKLLPLHRLRDAKLAQRSGLRPRRLAPLHGLHSGGGDGLSLMSRQAQECLPLLALRLRRPPLLGGSLPSLPPPHPRLHPCGGLGARPLLRRPLSILLEDGAPKGFARLLAPPQQLHRGGALVH